MSAIAQHKAPFGFPVQSPLSLKINRNFAGLGRQCQEPHTTRVTLNECLGRQYTRRSDVVADDGSRPVLPSEAVYEVASDWLQLNIRVRGKDAVERFDPESGLDRGNLTPENPPQSRPFCQTAPIVQPMPECMTRWARPCIIRLIGRQPTNFRRQLL
jgi:hypothetical protein